MSPQPSRNLQPARLAVLVSGRGRNLDAIIKAIRDYRLNAEIVLVASDKTNAAALQVARHAHLPCVAIDPRVFDSREAFDRALAARVDAERPDWVVLAGYMRILSSGFVQRFQGRLVNIHPSLLPRYKGLNTHARVLANGDARHGASVHFVTDDLDDGPLIRQGSIAIRADDSADTLADRVMARVEQPLYTTVLAELAAGRIVCHEGQTWRDGRIQTHCPHEDYDCVASTYQPGMKINEFPG